MKCLICNQKRKFWFKKKKTFYCYKGNCTQKLLSHLNAVIQCKNKTKENKKPTIRTKYLPNPSLLE